MKDDKRVKQIQKLLDVAEGNLASARHLLLDITGEKKTGKTDHKESAKDLSILDEGKVIEGIFDGEQMMAPDGKKYPVPANYASKSKLVEGDTLKLTISDNGSLIYKQIKPVERRNLVGALSYDGSNYSVLADGKNYKVLFASVTYYKGEPGNQVSIIIPASGNSEWAAMESVIHDHKNEENEKVEVEKEGKEKPENKDKEEKTENSKKPEVKKSSPKDHYEKKLQLPEENKEILKEVKESFDRREKEAEMGIEANVQSSSSVPQEPQKTVRQGPITQGGLDSPSENTEPEISDNMTVQEASQTSIKEQTGPPIESKNIQKGATASPQDVLAQNSSAIPIDEHPDIHHQENTYLEEASPFANEEKESNSLGEEIPAPTSQNEVKELEI